MSLESRHPTPWEEHHEGRSPRQGSVGSTASRVRFDDTASQEHLHAPEQEHRGSQTEDTLRRQRSSISVGLDALRHAGGVNSLGNFARSWQRAAGFYEITAQPQAYAPLSHAEEDGERFRRTDVEGGQGSRSLLGEQLAAEEIEPDNEAVAVRDPAKSDRADNETLDIETTKQSENRKGEDILDIAPHLASSFGAGYGTGYGSLSSRANESSMAHAGHLWRQQQARGVRGPEKEREPLLVRQVEREDGKVVNVVVGQSTLPQTVFNAVNVLAGVGLLSLPLGVRYAGWLIGMGMLLFAALVTSYTAKILATCLDVDETLITFGDLAYISFGRRARVLVSVLFCLEIMAACVALVVLFADSLHALIPSWGVLEWKVVCAIVLMPLGFLPLRILSFSSFLGILCCLGIVIIIVIDGLIKPHAPGSLREPARTYLWPTDWSMLPISFGLMMSPWGGHSVFPNIYKDMRHPRKFAKGITITYIFTYLLDLSMIIAGLLMFGDGLKDEVTLNILSLKEQYPAALSACIMILVAILPLTKIPLNARPIISTIEIFAGLDVRTISENPALLGMSSLSRGVLKFTIRILIMIIIVAIAIVFPSFDRIMALMGSALCFSICVILPLIFYLKIFGKEISLRERLLDYVLIVVSSVLAIIGTVWACLPRKE